MSLHLPGTALTIRSPDSLSRGSVSMVWRRVQPEYSIVELVPANRELLMSDVFEVLVSHVDVSDNFILKIPVYSKLDQFEDIYMKTDRDDYISNLQIRREGQVCWNHVLSFYVFHIFKQRRLNLELVAWCSTSPVDTQSLRGIHITRFGSVVM